MNLAQGNERPRLLVAGGPDFHQESCSIALDDAVRVLLGKSEIESISPVSSGKSAGPRAETVNQPGNASQGFRAKDGESSFDRH